MNNIIEPLRLAVGSHSAGSGKGCAMNVISWESGDSTITDFPGCADPFLARVVQRVNDTICTHREGGDLLCPPCSVDVLALGHRTVGTALDVTPAQRARVYVEIAVEEAESVLGRTEDERPRAACALVRRFLAGEDVSPSELRDAAYAHAYAYADGAAYAAAHAAAYAAYAYVNVNGDGDGAATAAAHAVDGAHAYAHAYAYGDGDGAAYAAAHAAYGAHMHARLARAHRIIDRFEEITGVRAPAPESERTAQAVACMIGASA